MISFPSIPSRFAWSVLAVAAVLTIVSGLALGFSVPLTKYVMTVPLTILLIAGGVIYSGPRPMPGIAKTFLVLAYLLMMGLILGPMSYIFAGFNFPLIDGTLAQLDRAVGFDWRWLQRTTAESAWASFLGDWIYGTSGVQLVLAVVMLSWLRNEQRFNQFLSGFMLATLMTLAIAAVLPAAGGYPYYGLGEADYGHLSGTGAGVSYLDQFHAVRMGTLRRLGVEPPQGLTQFPSFHTVVALMSGWALWPLRRIGPVNAAYSGLVILTTLPIGGHHLMDLLGAAAVVAFSLRIAGRAENPAEPAASATDAEASFRWLPASPAR